MNLDAIVIFLIKSLLLLYFLLSWRQYLEFLEKIYPTKTGLKIPQSKKPTEFAKHYPEPSSDWPKVPLKFQETATDEPSPSDEESCQQKPHEILAGRIEKVKVCNVIIISTLADPGFLRQVGGSGSNLLFDQFLPKTAWKWEKLDPLNPARSFNIMWAY